MEDLQHVLTILNQVNRQAGAIVRRYFGANFEIERKSDQSPVTEADREVERFLRSALEKHFPDHSVLGEEYGETKRDSAYRWIIDPIDGTRSFILRTPLFGTLIALECDGVPILGSIYLPIQNQLLIGSPQTGTFLEGQPVHVSKVRDLSRARLMITDPTLLVGEKRNRAIERLCGRVELVRGFGDCYGYFLVAIGAADIMIDPVGLKYYDVAALGPVIEGAGGKLTNTNGRSDLYEGSALATNGLLHQQVLHILNDL
jgi:histidinol phosphatase-like enzyme (inositol monophosphatase family)